MKTVIVTGGRGQLGLSLAKVAEEYSQWRFVLTDMPEADITDKGVMGGLLDKHRADAVINCAAYTAVDKAESEPGLARKINVDGAAVLAGLCRDRGIPMVHISTDYVFDGTATEPLREDAPTNPIGVYGRTKLEGENAVLGSGADVAVIRTAWLYSEFGNNFVKTMLRLAESRPEINVVCDQTGTPTYAPDLARAIMAVAGHGIKGAQIYHYSNEGKVSWAGFAAEIFKQKGLAVRVNPIPSSEYPTPAARPAWSVLDKAKIKGIGAEVPQWRESLAVCLENL